MSESSGLPPEQEAVRRLLADARHDGPPPPDVVARLDDTLASLDGRARVGAHRRPRDRARRPLAGTRRRPRLPPTPGGGHRPAGRRLRRRRGCRDRPGPPPRRQRRRESSAGSQSDTSLAESPEAGGSSADASAGSGAPGRRLRCRLRARAGVAEELSRQPRRRAVPTPVLDDDADLDDQLLALRPDGATRRQQLASARRAPGLRRPRSGPGRRPGRRGGRRPDRAWSCSVAPSARRRASSSTSAARPFRCVRSRCPRPERCGRGVEQRSPTIG